MASLQTLDVSTNSFSGTLPASWAQLPKLEQLNVSAASIHGPLPRSWLSDDLYTLDFSQNQLTGAHHSTSPARALRVPERSCCGCCTALAAAGCQLEANQVRNAECERVKVMAGKDTHSEALFRRKPLQTRAAPQRS